MSDYHPDTNVGNIEYISKADAVDRMNHYGSIWMEYTEGMSKHEVAERALKASKQAVIDVLENLPSASVAPVVRCKDCCYFRKFLRECERSGALTMYPLHDTDFCSYGERRE